MTELGQLKSFLDDASGPDEHRKRSLSWLFLSKVTRQKSTSLEHMIGFLAFAVGRLWPKKHNIIR